MTSLDWEFFLTALIIASAVLGLLVKWKRKAIYGQLRAGVMYLFMWVYSAQYEAAKREKKDSESPPPS